MVYFIRHGQTDWNLEGRIQGQTDILLNDTGRLQVRDALSLMSDSNVDIIYSSDLSRTKETAYIINEKYGVSIIYDDRIRELGYGDLEGVSRDKFLPNTFDIFKDNPEYFHAESMKHLYDRLDSFFSELDFSKDILVVTHGGTLRMILFYIENDFFDKNLYDSNYRNLKISNASVLKWDVLNKSNCFLSK